MSFTWHGSSLLNHNLLYRSSLHLLCPVSRLCNICNEDSCSMLSVNFISINSTVLTCVKWASPSRNAHALPLVFVRKSISSETIPTLNLLVLFVILLVFTYLEAFGLLAPYLERACFLLATPAVSSVPRIMWYLVPGKSLTRPPRIITTLCSCKLCPSPGM